MTTGSDRGSRSTGALTIVVALGMLLTACSTDREVTTPEPLPVTDKLLDSALLTTAELPGTWAAVDGEPASADVVPGHDCDEAVTELDPDASATTTFTRDSLDLTHVLAWFPSQGRAAEQVYRDLLEDCRSVVVDDDGLSVRTADLDFGVLSDDTLPIRVELEAATGQIVELDLLVMRRGDLLQVIRLTGPRPSDKSLLDAVARVALGRLGRLHQDTT